MAIVFSLVRNLDIGYRPGTGRGERYGGAVGRCYHRWRDSRNIGLVLDREPVQGTDGGPRKGGGCGGSHLSPQYWRCPSPILLGPCKAARVREVFSDRLWDVEVVREGETSPLGSCYDAGGCKAARGRQTD